MGKYDDIIALEHPVSQHYPRMSSRDRAAQFAPFAALTGYESVIAETGRETSEKLELDEAQLLSLNESMRTILDNLTSHPRVRLGYFVPDRKKHGGSYMQIEGNVRNVDQQSNTMVLVEGLSIPLENIYEITLL